MPARRPFRRLWAFVREASTISWLWSIGGGSVVSVILRQLTSLPVAWLIVAGVGVGCLILASIATFVPLGRPSTEPAAPAPPGSGFDPSKWAVTYGGFLVRSDYDAGHEWQEQDAKSILLWLRPPRGEPVDPNIYCQVKAHTGEVMNSPTVAQVGGPTGPGAGKVRGVSNADYLIVYPRAFSDTASLTDGMYEVLWFSDDALIHGDSFVMKDGVLVQ